MTNSSKQVTIVGSFVLGALILFVGLILTMGGNKWARDVIEYRIYFPTSVKGLSVGAPVMFRGISIGEVNQINLAPQKPGESTEGENFRKDVLPVEVFVKIFPERLGYYSTNFFKFLPHNSENIRMADAFLGNMVLRHNLRAELETLSFLTGQIYISLNFANIDNEPENMASTLWADRVIPYHLSLLDMMSQKMKENGFTNRLESMRKLVQDVAEFVDKGGHTRIMNNITTLTDNLASTSTRIDANLPQITEQINTLSNDLKETIEKVNLILESVRDDLPATVTNTKELVGNLNGMIDENREDIKVLIAHLDKALVTAQTDMEQAQVIIANLQDVSGPNSPERQRVQEIMRECDQLMMQLRELLEKLNTNPQAFILGN